ncbi:hypothetical protein [Embleya sp. MST-111070]|uniref:hypothetical protein n=1 Tax=Embleya sp. MST-111070 TaxID=3398231 RepID=UPI003F7417A0
MIHIGAGPGHGRVIRVVVLGEYRADRLVGPLRRAGAEVVVLGFLDLAAYLGPDVLCGRLPADASDDTILALLDDWRADITIPNMCSPGQEQALRGYARIGPRRRASGHEMPVHSREFAVLATDKVAFHRVAERRGWPAPRGAVCAGPRELITAADRIGLPAVVKEARSESLAGRRHVPDRRVLHRIRTELRYPLLLQEAVRGEEFAVELLSGPARTIAWPIASLGPLDAECAPGRRARVQPATVPERARRELARVIADIVRAARPFGPWQIDFAVSDDGRLHLIELNGRCGGVSNMSWACTGLDPHAAHVAAVLGRMPPAPHPRRAALEFPVPNGVLLPAPPPGIDLLTFPGNPGNQGPWHSGAQRVVLVVPRHASARARVWLQNLPAQALSIRPGPIVTQLAHGMRTLATGSGTVPNLR